MSAQTSEPDTLEALQSSKQVALLDAIDHLRSRGVTHHDISLPQLIVCGEQSSGKSSVLAALTGLPFPTHDTLCTTFATAVILRQGSEVKITCSISPGKGRSPAQKEKLKKFVRSYTTRKDFPFSALLDEARNYMTFGTNAATTLFSTDVLQIIYTGPEVPSLTIIDLPGLIQSQIESKPREGIQQVRDLVRGYMMDNRSIILAVVSARNDLNNQSIFEHLQELDPDRSRSLGILTKPDTLDKDSKSEKLCLELAKNQKYPLKLGWHVVKNRGYEDRSQTDAERNEAERVFLSSRNWSSIPRADVGIDSLRIKLSEVLHRHICKELPNITEAIQDAITLTGSKINALGSPREGPKEQRVYLHSCAEKFFRRTDNALKGYYSDPFFALSEHSGGHATRLRTKIQNLNLAFAAVMYSKGHTWEFQDDPEQEQASLNVPNEFEHQEYDAAFDQPQCISRASFLETTIGKFVKDSRPPGLPSLVNPWVIGAVFRGQSELWEEIARFHLVKAFATVKEYICLALESLMDVQTFKLLMREQINPELDRKWHRLEAKLKELLKPYNSNEPTIYDPSFTFMLNNTRSKRYAEETGNGIRGQLNAFRRSSSSARHLLTDSIDDYTNIEILDMMEIYYKRSISVFIQNVALLAVENTLVDSLEDVFSPSLVLGMSEEQVQTIASESDEIRTERANLKQNLEDLKGSKQVLDAQVYDSRATSPISSRAQQVTPSRLSPPHHSRSRTPTPKSRAPSFSVEEVDNLTSNFKRLNASPPRRSSHTRKTSDTQISSVTPSKRAVTPSSRAAAFNSVRSQTALLSETEDEEFIA